LSFLKFSAGILFFKIDAVCTKWRALYLCEKKMYYSSRVYRYRQRFPILFIVVKLRHSRQIQIRSLSLPREFLIILRSNLRSQDIIIIQQLLKIARTLGTRRVDAIFVLRPSAVPCAFISRATVGYMSSCPSCTTSAGDRHGTRVVVMCRRYIPRREWHLVVPRRL
jgi:hypothetical protein